MAFLFNRTDDYAPKGERVVRGLALVMATLAILAGIRSHGGGAYLCWVATGMFLLTAALPRSFGKIAGTVIMVVSGLALFMGPYGEPVFAAQRFLAALPAMLVGGVLINPSIVDAIAAMFTPSD